MVLLTLPIAGLLVMAAPATPATQADPDARIEAYLAAAGGRDKLARISSRVTRVNFHVPGRGKIADGVLLIVPPDRSLTRVDFGASRSVTGGLLGDVAWEIDAGGQARLLEGGEKQSAILAAQVDPLLEWRRFFAASGASEPDQVDGRPCTGIELVPARGDPVVFCIDDESNLIVKISTLHNGELIQTLFSDFRVVDGVKIPHRSVVVSPRGSLEIRVESVEHNVEISQDEFRLPPRVAALIGK